MTGFEMSGVLQKCISALTQSKFSNWLQWKHCNMGKTRSVTVLQICVHNIPLSKNCQFFEFYLHIRCISESLFESYP